MRAEDGRHDNGARDSADDSDYSDLEDFIVCKPGRDKGYYKELFQKEFRYTAKDVAL